MKYVSNILTIGLIVLSVFFLIDGFEAEKYKIYHAIYSPFQKEYERSTYYNFKVPKEWVKVDDKDEYKHFLGPVWTDSKVPTKIQVITNYEKLVHYMNYFDPLSCKHLIESDINNSVSVKAKNYVNNVTLPAKIYFCEDKESYVSYANEGTMTFSIIKPYSHDYKDKYVKLFKEIDDIILEDEIPDWIYK